MLYEITKVRQNPGEPRRRWFTDDAMDLFVWCADDGYTGFQLSFGKPADEHAITWRRGEDLQHTRVDDGSRPGQYPGSPLLVADGEFDRDTVLHDFLSRAEAVENGIVAVVAKVLRDKQSTAEAPNECPRPGWFQRLWQRLTHSFR